MISYIALRGIEAATDDADNYVSRRRRGWLAGKKRRRRIVRDAVERIEQLENGGLEITRGNVYTSQAYGSASMIAWFFIKLIVPLVIEWFLNRKKGQRNDF